ncbi:MAG: DEAD/DEAH box helicase [Bacillota bacterium]
MNAQDKIYFSALSKYRAKGADLLEEPYMRGVKKSVVEKYSDQAHFIYELIQNADDAGATSARFDLNSNELIFAHNGTRRFSISNPETEELDTDAGKLGDINAITSIANSNKTEASIGKFGVGFKAVFQYTQTPSAYDPNFRFRIERFIVPVQIEEDFFGRKKEETLFVFPFNHADRSSEAAYDDIFNKLRSLIYPVLFLTNLNEITFECSKLVGIYTKVIDEVLILDDTIAQLITLSQKNGDDENEVFEDKLWLFTRTDELGNAYSVGFSLNTESEAWVLQKSNYAAFCYFPTKEVSGLNFIVHAPFLLTDSREGIRAGVEHNNNMVSLLAELAADSFVYLKDIGQQRGMLLINDHIFDVIPYDDTKFNDINDRNRISFKPFYTAIKKKFSNEKLLPSSDGFVYSQNAYWAVVPQITEIISNEQLSRLAKDYGAKWVFASFGRQETTRSNKQLADYIDSLTENWFDHEDIIGFITDVFIEEQPISWLHLFYSYVADTIGRTKLIKSKAIFLNQNYKAVAAFDLMEQAILFLPTEEENGYETVNFELLENEKTVAFLNQLGITVPSLKDEIYNKILPQYKNGIAENARTHSKKFFQFYQDCTQAETQTFISLLKDCNFVLFSTANDEQQYLSTADSLYFPHESLQKWFQAKPDTKFIEFDEYLHLFGEDHKEGIIRFFTDIGVKNEPMVISFLMNYEDAMQISTDWPKSTRQHKWIDKYIDGSKEIIEFLIQHPSPDVSVIVWDQLLKFVENGYAYNSLRNIMQGKCEYLWKKTQFQLFDSSEAIRLRTKPWLVNKSGAFVAADELTFQMLSTQYNTSSAEVIELLQFLGIDIDGRFPDYDDKNLTDEQRIKIELAEALSDIPPDDLRRFAEQYRANKHVTSLQPEFNETTESAADISSENSAVSLMAKEISKRAVSTPKEKENLPPSENETTLDSDEDDFTKPSVDFSKKIELAKQKSAGEIEKIAYLDELTKKALNTAKYSFGWFKALLELESLNSGENSTNSREISITFSKVELEKGTLRTLVLKHPSRYIPQSMEDLADIPLELHFADQPMVKVAVEVVNVKSYTLRAKLRTNAQIDGLDLSLVKEAKIEAKNPVFLIEELRKAFNKLGFDDDYDMQSNLCKNIEFVFGPPGTGKTTHLAREVILKIMREAEDLKVLVLTPTNKAADVLINRLMESMGTDHSYIDWLVRFGVTNDSTIEQSGVFRDKTFDIRNFKRNVTVTTIARFPYDYFLPDEATRLHLSYLEWDYIIIDEASMIPIANILFPLYKKTPKKFFIAGDPFQIEPITTVDIWKNENIYTMVELKSFTEPTTIPMQYHVELLTTQYRSIPDIGEVFSKFAYGGVLKHNRLSDSKIPLCIDDIIDVKPLNIIKFPVSKYESIFRPKRLQSKSNYQIYSALFAFEFVKYLSSLIERANDDKLFRIGLIAPYRAQSDLIDKLMSSAKISKNIDIQVGTIHGFQGDECDIVIALFNPPPSISTSKDMFLNKLNIINVSISRARDYLFVIMPDDNTENIGNLTLIKTVEKLCKEQPQWVEHLSPSIEEFIFGSKTFLEDNSFSTSHQLVNVYGKPEKRYEIRSEDNAVDVQIHE